MCQEPQSPVTVNLAIVFMNILKTPKVIRGMYTPVTIYATFVVKKAIIQLDSYMKVKYFGLLKVLGYHIYDEHTS